MQTVPPTPDEIRAQLKRVLASEAFVSSTRLQRFLRFVVERSLAGEGGELKEYAIGIGVFDRDEQYDPRIDSIVRVEAGRLRTKIDEHYNGAGASDDLVIRIPRGTYAPVFERRQNGAAAAAPVPTEAPGIPRRRIASWRLAAGALAIALLLTAVAAWSTNGGGAARPAPSVTIAVLPFALYSTDPSDQMLAARLTDGVTGELARIGTIGVVSRTSALQFAGGVHRPLREIAQALKADMVVEASVETEGDTVRIQTRLVDGLIDRKGWLQDFEGRRESLRELERRIAEAIAANARPRRTR